MSLARIKEWGVYGKCLSKYIFIQSHTRRYGKESTLLLQYTWIRGGDLKSDFQAICFLIFFSCNHNKIKPRFLTCAIETTEVKPHFSGLLLVFEHHKEYNERDGEKNASTDRGTQRSIEIIPSMLVIYFSAVSCWQIILKRFHKIGSISNYYLFSLYRINSFLSIL